MDNDQKGALVGLAYVLIAMAFAAAFMTWAVLERA